jgi:hypothetical protein
MKHFLFILVLLVSSLQAASSPGVGFGGGSGGGGLPYLNSITHRPRRVLCLGDSMFQHLIPSMLTGLDSNVSVLSLRGLGENTALTGSVMAPDSTYLARPGNTFLDSRITEWTASRCDVTLEMEPQSGLTMYKIVDNGELYGVLSVNWTITAAQAAGCYVSFLIKQPSDANAEVSIDGSVGATQKFGYHFKPSFYIGDDVGRIGFSLPPGWASENDELSITINWAYGSWGHDTTFYLGEWQVNLGGMPARYEPTYGEAGTAGALQVVPTVDGIDRNKFDLVVICHYNDCQFGYTRSFSGLSSLVDSALRFAPRVLLLVPPPSVTAGAYVDDDLPNDWRYTVRDVANAHNTYLVDSYQTALNYVAAGTYTVAQLMDDQIHPSILGTEKLFADAIIQTLNGTTEKIPIKRGPGACLRVGSLVTTGTWSIEPYASPYLLPYEMSVAHDLFGVWCQKSTDADATITYTVTGHTISLLHIYTGDAGALSVSVDGRDMTMQINLASPVRQRSLRLSDPSGVPIDFGAGEHTVVVTLVSGTVRLIGCVGF